MKTKINTLIAFAIGLVFTGCHSVPAGHEASIVRYSTGVDTNKVLHEGTHFGLNFIWDDAIDYDVREQTQVISESFNDKNDMVTVVEATVYYRPTKGQVNKLHKYFGTSYAESKLVPVLRSSLAKTVPQFTAVELNKTHRQTAESLILETILKESGNMYTDIIRIQIGKVEIPKEVARLAEETAVQEGRNVLASKKEEEQVQLAKARVAEAQGRYEAGVLDAKTRDLLSQPKMLELQRVDNERLMWEGFKAHGKSPFGENNIFGQSGSPALLLNRK